MKAEAFEKSPDPQDSHTAPNTAFSVTAVHKQSQTRSCAAAPSL